jgi:hypothetical protein
MCIGGPALVYYVSPTEEELFKVRGMTSGWMTVRMFETD